MSLNIVDEFRRQYSTLRNSNADNVSGRLLAIVDWVCKQQETKEIIEKLCASVDKSKVFPQERQPTIAAYTREEIAFAGYTLMTNCQDNDFWQTCLSYDIRGPNNSSNMDEIAQAGLREYIVPFLDYVESELVSATSESTMTSLLEMRLSAAMEQRIAADLPATSRMIEQIATEFSRPDDEVHWQNVGNSCRQTLQNSVKELTERHGLVIGAETKKGDVKAITKQWLKSSNIDEESRRTLADLIDSVWNHTQSITHRPTTTKQEALRTFIWTTLAISEFLGLIQLDVQTE
jgi:hypothetical protein